jgi:hypothetical protein
LTPVDRAGEGHLHDPGALIGIDPARTAPAPARAQGREAIRVEGEDQLGHGVALAWNSGAICVTLWPWKDAKSSVAPC